MGLPMSKVDIADNDEVNKDKEGNSRAEDENRKNRHRLITLEYAILIVSMGLVAHLSYAFKPTSGTDLPIDIFIWAIEVMGIAGVVFLWTVCRREKTGQGRNVLDHHNGNIYMKGGIVIFCVGGQFYYMMNLAEDIELSLKCHTYVSAQNLMSHTTSLVFNLTQLIFLLKHTKVCIQRRKWPSKLALMHLVAVNICIWMRTVIKEGEEALEVYDRNNAGNSTAHADVPDGESCVGLAHEYTFSGFEEMASPVLYPAIIEYSLLSAGFLAVMWANVGGEHTESPTTIQQHPRHERTYYIQVHCKNSSIGFICGISALLLVLISLTLYVVNAASLDSTTILYTKLLYQSTLTTLNLAMVLATALTFRRLKGHGVSHYPNELDKPLMLITMMGMHLYNVFTVVSSMWFGDVQSATMTAVTYIVQLVQCVLQTSLILDALQRSPSLKKALRSRNYVVFLLLGNVALWITAMFELKQMDINQIPLDVFGSNWVLVLGFVGPLMVFYRFHSTAAFFDIWVNAYG